MTATLVFGGTFDPVHNGHLSSARDLLNLIEGARVVLVPCQIPAHRPVPATPATDRLAMLQLAAEGIDARSRNIEVVEEIKRDAVDFYARVRSLYRQHRQDLINDGAEGDDAPAPGLTDGGDIFQTSDASQVN